MEQETQKLKEKEQSQIREIKEWKENLRPRKKVRKITCVFFFFFYLLLFHKKMTFSPKSFW